MLWKLIILQMTKEVVRQVFSGISPKDYVHGGKTRYYSKPNLVGVIEPLGALRLYLTGSYQLQVDTRSHPSMPVL